MDSAEFGGCCSGVIMVVVVILVSPGSMNHLVVIRRSENPTGRLRLLHLGQFGCQVQIWWTRLFGLELCGSFEAECLVPSDLRLVEMEN